MKEGGHIPHYFLSREGVRLCTTEDLQLAVEDFINRKEERQVTALQSLMPTIVKLATSSSQPSRVKGLTQLWEAAQRLLHHNTILVSGMEAVHDGLTSGSRVGSGTSTAPALRRLLRGVLCFVVPCCGLGQRGLPVNQPLVFAAPPPPHGQ